MESSNIGAGKREFDMAWQEFFKDKPRPKNDEEERREQEEFHHWYNNVRKQSDTGKTPVEMYKEIYGKEPPENPTEVSRIMNFGWDEYSDEEEFENFEEAQEQAVDIANEIFENEIWQGAKKDLKEASKKEACKSMFSLGFLAYMKIMDEESANLRKKAKENPEEFEKVIDKFNKIMDE